MVAVDDFGNDLHPFAIRALTEALRDWAEERQLVVCLASHSPVLLDEFKEEPGSVFVMEHGLENRPVGADGAFRAGMARSLLIGEAL